MNIDEKENAEGNKNKSIYLIIILRCYQPVGEELIDEVCILMISLT